MSDCGLLIVDVPRLWEVRGVVMAEARLRVLIFYTTRLLSSPSTFLPYLALDRSDTSEMGRGSLSFRLPNVQQLLVVFLGLLSVATAARNGLIGTGRRNRIKQLYTTMGGQKPDSLLRKPVTDVNGTIIPNYNVIYEFAQLIDHGNPSLGTFIQRYYHTWEFYKPGGSIVLTTPGEQSMDGTQLISLLSHTPITSNR